MTKIGHKLRTPKGKNPTSIIPNTTAISIKDTEINISQDFLVFINSKNKRIAPTRKRITPLNKSTL